MTTIKNKLYKFYSQNSKLVQFLIYCVWALLLGSIIWAAWQSRDQLLPNIVNANWEEFLLVVFYYIFALIFSTSNWIAIIHGFTDSIPIITHIKIYLLTLVTRRLPGTIWYIGGRIVLYKKIGISEFQTASASGIELIVSLAANCFLAGIFLPFTFNLSNYWLIPIILITAISLIVLNPTVITFIMKRMNRPLEKPIKGSQVAFWFILRIGVILTGSLMIFQTIRVFFPLNTSMLFMVFAARALSGAAGMLTMFLPSSFGASDITLIALISTFIPASLATAIAIFVRLYTSVFELAFGLLFFILLKNIHPKNDTFLKPKMDH